MSDIYKLTEQEFKKQRDTLNLIASENYPSPKTLELLGSVWSNKYAEGYPGKRYYAGNQFTDELEDYVSEKALEIFNTKLDEGFDIHKEYGVNIQVLSGSPANAMVYLSILNYGDTIMSLAIDNGGHISHMHKTSSWNKFFKHINYDVKETSPSTYEIDIETFKKGLREYKPKLVIIGFSAYPRKYEFSEMCRLAHESGAFVLADVAHINGLIASKLHHSPFQNGLESADFVTMTTHKTFRGPRGAMVFAKNYLPDYLEKHFLNYKKKPKSLISLINKTVFPGTSGGPHMNKIAAIGQACLEILGQDKYPDNKPFNKYSLDTIKNTKALEEGLEESGLEVISPSQNHLCLVKLPKNIDSLESQINLENLGIITNRNGIPFDKKSPWRPSGMRFGMAALTSRGITIDLSKELGKTIADIVLKKTNQELTRQKILKILDNLNWYYNID